jgi:murein DD-endopeptidase MepM/ murein hydrolase activator NlpD/GH24 family phage-related lysozyme (muramidase)
MDVQRKIYVGIVEENIDPNRKGRIKVRVQTIFNEIPVESIPYASPFASLSGKEFQIPAIGKLVNILYFSDDIYDPYYIYSENYNINLQNKLKGLSDDEYVDFVALLFDDRTQIHATNEELTIDYLFNKITINNSSINHELKDNSQHLNLGSKSADQDAVLGTNFFEWMDKFIDELSSPFSLIGNVGAPIIKPKLKKLCLEYKALRPDFVSNNVKIVDNNSVDKLTRDTDNRKNDVDLVLGEPDEVNDKILNDRIQSQNDKACEQIKASSASSFIPTETDMILPLIGKRISSRFGLRVDPTNPSKMQGHGGVDIADSIGTPVKSPYDGTVIQAAFDNVHGGGNSIRITHTNKFTTGYCHLSQMLVKKGDKVKKGDIIGKVGNTGGHTTGPHLHFTVTTPANEKIDPELYFTWPVRSGDAPKKNGLDDTNGKYQGQQYTTKSNNTPCNSNGNVDSEKDNLEDSPYPDGDPIILKGGFYDKVLSFIIPYEGFISKSRWDVNAWRVGYGSDTITRNDQVHKVEETGPYSTTTKDEAKNDLLRRVKEFEKILINQVGGKSVYDKIPDTVKIALLDNVYNYGSLIGKNKQDRAILVAEINKAIKTGKWSDVGNKLIELTWNHNAGKSFQTALRQRRREEATLIAQGGVSEHLV